MIPSMDVCQKSSLYLNEHVTALTDSPASFFIHYWGAKPRHGGNTPHSHAFLEICYVADGTGTYVHNGIAYPLRRGTLYCSKPDSAHHVESDGNMLLLFVAFELVRHASEPEFVSRFDRLSRLNHLFVAEADSSPAALAWHTLLHYCAAETVDYPQVARRLAHSMVLAALSMFFRQGGYVAEDGAPDAETAYAGPLKAAKDYVAARLTAKLTLKELARAIHLSERQLSRLLSERLGLSFPAWLRNERLRRAAYLLAYTDIKLEHVAEQTGFDSVHYFSTVFGEHMGITPAKFRRTVQSGEADPELIRRYLHTATNRNRNDTA